MDMDTIVHTDGMLIVGRGQGADGLLAAWDSTYRVNNVFMDEYRGRH